MLKPPRMVPDILIHVDEAEARGGSGRALRDACRRGLLVRVRRGSYCPADIWSGLTESERHQLAIYAVLRRIDRPALVAGASAAAVWGLPYAARALDDVTLLVPYAGGGSSEAGVRRSCVSFGSARGVDVDGVLVTDLPRTVLDHVRGAPFARAVAVADFVQSRRREHPLHQAELLDELERAAYVRGGTFARGVVGFSTSLSDSPGESECRAAIHVAGFEPPELQRRWRDDDGEIETDYFWDSAGQAGEFDGKVKYTRAEFTAGDPAEVVWREKRREDRLRRQVSGVVRLVTEEVRRPLVLARILDDAGIPRRARRVLGGTFDAREPRVRGSLAR